MQPAAKRRAIISPDGVLDIPTESSELLQIRLPDGKRKEILQEINIHDPTSFAETKFSDEDMLNMDVAEKLEDTSALPDGNRIIMTKIVVENFKSYQNRNEIGPLHKNLNMVIGANGSGKSNVSDAILFCFGADKSQLRCNALKDLINDLPLDDDDDPLNVGSCLVSLYFHEIHDVDENRYVVVEDSHFTIGRSVDENGISKFYHNDKICSERKIHLLLKNMGIDMKFNRCFIVQGEVEKISQMNPVAEEKGGVGMIEFIEAFVGTERFKRPIYLLAKKTKEIQVKSSGEWTLYNNITINLESYFKQASLNVYYINNHNKLNWTRGLIIKHEMAPLKIKLDEARGSLKRMEEESTERRNIRKKAIIDQKAAKQQLDVTTKAVNEAENQLRTSSDKYQEWKEEKEKTKTELQRDEKKVRSLTIEIDKIQNQLNYEATVPETLREDLQTGETFRQDLEARERHLRTSYTQHIVDFENAAAEDRQQLAELKQKLSELDKEKAEATSSYNDHQWTINEMMSKNDSNKKRIQKLQREIDGNNEDIEDFKREMNKLKSERRRLQKQIANGKPLPLAAQKLALDVKIIDDEICIVRSWKDLRDGAARRCKPAQDLLAAKGKLNGIIGCLGDMASVDIKFEKVMTIMYMPLLNTVLTETSKDSVAAIEYMKENKIPRLQFIPKDQVYAKMYNAGMNRRSEHPRLIDQINFHGSEEVRIVFYYHLGEMLVVETKGEAESIRQKYRSNGARTPLIVTLNGEVYHPGGAIEAGGAPKTGGIRIENFSPETVNRNLQDLKKERDKQQLEYDKCVKEAFPAQKSKEYQEATKMDDLKRDIGNWEDKIEKHTKKVRRLAGEIARPERADEAVIIVPQEEIEQVQREMRSEKETADRLQNQISTVKAEIKRINDEIDNIFYEMVTEPNNQQKRLAIEIEELDKTHAGFKVRLDRHPDLVKSLKEKLEEKKKDKEDAERNYQETRQKDNEEFRKKGKELEEDINEKQANLEDKKQEHRDSYAEELKYSQELTDATENYNNYQSLIDRAENDRYKLQYKLSDLENEWERCETNFLDVDTYDGKNNYVLEEDPDLEEKMAAGYILLPFEISQQIESFDREEFQNLPAVSLNQINELRNEEANLMKRLNDIRSQTKMNGIRYFSLAMVVLVSTNDSRQKVTEELKKHREKLIYLKNARFTEFQQALSFISSTTKILYRLVTDGGDASLKFVGDDSTVDAFKSGVKFSVRPPKKSWKQIQFLSGGEKTLASLCFIFALHNFRATPLYIMDEIDASLDIKNVSIIAKYLKESGRTSNAQFVIISLRNQMYDVGNRLIGIYKTQRGTLNVIVTPGQVERTVKGAGKVLKDEIDEMTGEKEKEREEELARQMSKVGLRQTKERKLAGINLRDFTGDEDDDKGGEMEVEIGQRNTG